MCPHLWQDKFNLQKKDMTPVDIRSLLLSLEAIKHVSTQESSNAQSTEKSSHKGEKGNKRPGTKYTGKVPNKAGTKKHCDFCKKQGVCTPLTIPRIVVGTRKIEHKNPISMLPRKAERNPIPKSTLLCS
jgi:hypothetical protein